MRQLQPPNRRSLLRVAGVLVIGLLARPSAATHPCNSPLVLDLNADGIHTADLFYPVQFDINGDGDLDTIGWTDWMTEEGFLALDLNQNGKIDNGSELFGNSMVLPTGVTAQHGFEALALYDLPEFGGDADGAVTSRDLIWPFLRVWVDANHDGVSQPREIRSAGHYRIERLELNYIAVNELDGNVNLHALRGSYIRRVRIGRQHLEQRLEMTDIYFSVGPLVAP